MSAKRIFVGIGPILMDVELDKWGIGKRNLSDV